MRFFIAYSFLSSNKILQISAVEFFLARSLAFTFIFCNTSLLLNISKSFSSILSFFFSHIPTLCSSKNSAFSSSCPGIGFITIIGNPEAKISVVVKPPGLVITKS